MSFVLLGILNSQASGVAGVAYRLQTLGGNGVESSGGPLAADSGDPVTLDFSNNIFITGRTTSQGEGSSDLFLAKYDSGGVIQWQRILGGNEFEIGMSLVSNVSGDVYVFGETQSTTSNDDAFLIAKYNSAGTIQWQRTLEGVTNPSGSTDTEGYAIGIDSLDNIYVTGSTSTETEGSNIIIAKYNSGGAIQWQRTIDGGSGEEARSIAVDSSDNVYIGGYLSNEPGRLWSFILSKYDSSGTLQWNRALEVGAFGKIMSIAVDSSDNVYVTGYKADASDNLIIVKYNSGGTLQWQRTLSGANDEEGQALAVDSSDNVYVAASTESLGYDSFLIVKYDNSGTLQWQRTLGVSGDSSKPYGLAVDSLDNLYVFGDTNSTTEGSQAFLLAVLPNDGSLSGSYNLDGFNFVYAASSFTGATSTATAYTPNPTSATGVLTDSSSSLTSASASLTEHRVDL